jgi:hypothetical protein
MELGIISAPNGIQNTLRLRPLFFPVIDCLSSATL